MYASFLVVVTFSYKEIVAFFGHGHVTFPYMEHLSVSGRFVRKVIVSCFSASFVQKTTEQSDGSRNVTNDSQFLYKRLKKYPPFFLRTRTKNIL